MNSDKFFYVIVTVFTVLILFGIVFFSSKSVSNKSSKETKKIDTKELVGESPHIKGDLEKAKVIIVEFGDFQCPACKAIQPVVKQINEEFPNEVAFVYRHFPLISIHKYAFDAAVAAEAAALQNRFFDYHDLLYENQKENDEPLKKEDFMSFAKELGLNEDQFAQDLESENLKNRVQTDLNYARSLGLRGTPTFFVNGEQVPNNELYNKVKSLVSGN